MSHLKLIFLTLLMSMLSHQVLAQRDSAVIKNQIKKLIPSFSLKGQTPKAELVTFNGGIITYNWNYRTNIDTPVVEKNIQQHSATGHLNFGIAGIPFRVSYLLRRSNSQYFRDINDVQVVYDASMYRNAMQQELRKKLLAQTKHLTDNLLELQYKFSLEDFNNKSNLLNNPITLQRLFESKEILNIPTPDSLADSLGARVIAGLKQQADSFLHHYDYLKNELDSVKSQKEQVERKYHAMKDNIARYKNFINGDHRMLSTKALKDSLRQYGNIDVKPPFAWSFLNNVRNFSLGRTQLNYSELTGKNVSITGINAEYNSWYYLAIAAGTVDYRFRDFVINRFNKTPQYMYMLRAGVGRVEKNHIILTAYGGRKQLFASSLSGPGSNSINITGFAAEVKYLLASNVWVQAEVAQSLSPDYRLNPATKQKFSITDNSNKALAVKIFAAYPKTNTRFEGSYKYAGANFQSFSSFQTNSTIRAWNVKLDQHLFHRHLKLTAALKTNEFSNPYILQNYKANTTFKSLQATYRSRKLPMISVGYVPVSQLTLIDNMLAESRFYSFNGTISHSYKLARAMASTTFTYNKFYNNDSDTSFAYYNSKNYYINQVLDFKNMLMSWSVSYSGSTRYDLTTLNGFVSFAVGRGSRLGAGFKVNNFNNTEYKTGPYGSYQFDLKQVGTFNIVIEQGYLPANNQRFLRNDMMNVSFTRRLL
ncbi:hypothetical protein [Ferruginibacter sp. HRS2-29]|uniref:hypothetical protein n=1 Tax=Ferruginibacter sp. HRS2-29 TaxID=2487334 RepID=UPI0020CC1990|nr:hypothetical protein [Ferruginibacter sp. HRS2-29]MCP9752455.1 hypothetical protein [Ferruginibacter sp. HRS2-29]